MSQPNLSSHARAPRRNLRIERNLGLGLEHLEYACLLDVSDANTFARLARCKKRKHGVV